MIVPLSDIIAALESGVSVNSDDAPADECERGVLKVSCVAHGRFFPQENKRVLPSDADRVSVSVRAGDLLVTRANTFELIAACGIVDRDYANLFLPDKVWRVVLRDPSRDHIPWLNHVLNSPGVRCELKKRATGTSGSMKNIPQTSFLGITVFRPLFLEQQNIARVLDAWDRGIGQLADLIAAKVRFKRGLMQQLLTGKRRFPGFTGEWKHEEIGQYLEECSSRVSATTTLPVYTSSRSGLKPQEEYYGGRTIINDGEYGVVPVDCFVFRHMSDDGLFVFHINQTGGDIAVSKEYPVFRAINLDRNFLLAKLNHSPDFKAFALSQKAGGTRTRLYFSKLRNWKTLLPSLSEQRRIAEVLIAADREINLLRQHLDALKQQKKGLMQKLVTGQVRVKIKE